MSGFPSPCQPTAIPRLSADILQSRTAGWLNVFGRLRPGTNLDQSRAELKTVAAQLAHAYPQTNEHRGVDVLPGVGLDPDDKAVLAGFFRLLLVAVGALLLIACANVAGLTVIRATARRKEMAIRRAIGASAEQIVTLLLTEGLMVSVSAGLAGLLLAPAGAKLLLAFRQPLYSTVGLDVSPDWKVLAFTLAISVAAGLGFSWASLALGPRERSRTPSVLVALQIAVSLVLLVGAGLAARTLRNVLHSDFGFEARNLLLLPVDHADVLNRVLTLAGVEAASLATTVPSRDFSGRLSVFHAGQAPPLEQLRAHEFELGLRVDVDSVAPEFFRTLGIPLLAGRDFSSRDHGVAILSEALAQRLWPGQDAVGRRLEIPEPVQIVGVVKDIKYRSLLLPPPLLIYLPLSPGSDVRATLVVRTAGDPNGLLAALRRTFLPLAGAKTMSDEIAESLWQQQMAAGLIGAFGLLALVLAGVGIYTVTAHWVAQSTHDIGIRMAIGAQRGDIARLVLRRGLVVTLVGLALGVPAALAASRLLGALLFGTTPGDPLTFAAVGLLVAVTAFAASSAPARRAMSVDPVIAIRTE
jgi:predicted permease